MKHLPGISLYEVFKNRKQILKNPLPFHHENFQKFGDSFRVKVGLGKSVVFTRDPALIRHILQKQHKFYNKSPLQTRDLAKYIGHGILTSNGDHWRTHRRMVQPAFHKKKLAGLLTEMVNAIRCEVLRIQPDQTLDVFPLMGDLAFQVVSRTLFSRSDIKQSMAKLKAITEANQNMLIREMRQPYLKWWLRLSGQIREHVDLYGDACRLLNGIIEERIASGEEKDDLLDMLLQARYEDGSPMSREQLIDEVLILFIAGHETTANAMSFTLFLLAKHPQAQEKAFEEASSIDFEKGLQLEHLAKLGYITHCVEESMRLYPPAYYIDRNAIAHDHFKGMHIPKNTMILISLYELHRYADFWEDPDAFNPERFSATTKKELSDYYYPFGAGPRMCVGNNFAMYEMIMTVALLLRNYKLSTEITSVEINPQISLKPLRVPIHFKVRTAV